MPAAGAAGANRCDPAAYDGGIAFFRHKAAGPGCESTRHNQL